MSTFVGAAALLWLVMARWRRPSLWVSTALGFAAFLPADLWFFLAQRGSRVGQFPPFRLGPSLVRLAEYAVAALFGGLPLYAYGAARIVVGAALGAAAVTVAMLIVWRWRYLARDARWLLLGCTAAPLLGLLALGAVFDNTPIELRYLCFATPFAGLLLAGVLRHSPHHSRESGNPDLSRNFAPPLNPRFRRGDGMAAVRAAVLSLQHSQCSA